MKLKSVKTRTLSRWIVLAASTVFFLFFSHFISVHAVCPIGGFELFFTGLFRTGFSIAGLFSGMVLVFLVMSVLSLVFRRAYCGYICPLGAVQELFDRVGRVVLPKRIKAVRVPATVDRALRWVKYGVLALFVIGAAVWGGHWMIKADPFIALMSLSSIQGIVDSIGRNPSSMAFLAAILVFSFFLGRGFCSYLCPAGAWFGLLSKISPTRIERDEKLCVSCGACAKACPMNIDVAHLKVVKSAECLGCQDCVSACPKEGALSFSTGKLALPAVLVPALSAAAFSGAVYVAGSMSGGHGEGGPANGGTGGRPAGVPSDGSVRNGGQWHQSGNTVGYGGCPSCVGCGLCESATKA